MRTENEQIEYYLEGQLEGEELEAFETRMLTDAAFASEVNSTKEFLAAFKAYGNQKKMRMRLDEIHHEMISDSQQRGTVQIHSWYTTMAIAASVALVTSLSSVFVYQQWMGGNGNGKVQYRELRKDVERIKRSQANLIKAYQSEKSAVSPTHFNGTGFAISADGYVLTSYHVVKGTASLWIENDKFGRLIAKTVHTDPAIDLAILKVEDRSFNTFGRLPYTFSQSAMQLGDRVFTLGYPREELVYGEGYLGCKTGHEGDSTSCQISIPVNPGNSGGPLLDSKGNIVGMVSGKLTEMEGTAFALRAQYIHSSLWKWQQEDSVHLFKWSSQSSAKMLPRLTQIRNMQDFVFRIEE